MPEVQTHPLPSGDGDPTRGAGPSGRLTPYERYVLTFPEGMKGDLIGGEVVIDMSASRTHELIQNLIHFLLTGYVSARRLGQVYGSRTTMRVDDDNAFEPDILFVRSDRLGIVHEQVIVGAVDVAVEVVSKSSGRRDREAEFEGYQWAGVAEYWLIDPARAEAVFYRLDAEGAFRAVPLRDDGVFESVAVPGFCLQPQDLFADPVPEPYPLLQALLNTAGRETDAA